MPHEVLLTRGAQADLDELFAFLVGRLLDQLQDAVSGLGQFPSRGGVPRELKALGITDFRQTVFKAWRILYRFDERRVYVVLIVDGRRDLQALLERRLVGGSD